MSRLRVSWPPKWGNASNLPVSAGVAGQEPQQRRHARPGIPGQQTDGEACHFPPGTSKWNKIEHRLFSFIARNWRGQPLVSRQAVVSLIGATTSTAGLKVYAELDENEYERGIKITDAQLATVNLHPEAFHGEWNYRIKPNT